MTTSTSIQPAATARRMLNKVPEVTLLFWVVKILSTTVGETAADFLADNLGLGLSATSLIMSAVLVVVLVAQFRTRRYVPGVYWLAVVLISIVGTLISDNLVDNLGVSLWTTTAVFSVALAATFLGWYRAERTLSIHTITTRRRESFYWLAILFTFALGTSAGDLVSEQLSLGYATAAAAFAAVIAIVYAAYRLGAGAVLTFWVGYVLTRPFGASLGDLLTAARGHGGFGLDTFVVSGIFLVIILAAVGVFMVADRRSTASVQPELEGAN